MSSGQGPDQNLKSALKKTTQQLKVKSNTQQPFTAQVSKGEAKQAYLSLEKAMTEGVDYDLFISSIKYIPKDAVHYFIQGPRLVIFARRCFDIA